MDFQEYVDSTENDAPPEGLKGALLALWWDKRNDWEMAHTTAQDVSSKDGSWVHAYLHRKEGDAFNAGYWYSRAGKKRSDASLDEEWEQIVRELLKR